MINNIQEILKYNPYDSKVRQNDDSYFWSKFYIQQTIKNEEGKLYTGDDIFLSSERILIWGVAGSGKTTLCHYLNNLILKENKYKSYLINAKDFNNIENFDFQEYFDYQILSKSETKNEIYIIIDGLDEINPLSYNKIISSIETFFSINKKLRAIITSRQYGLYPNIDSFKDFEKCEIQLFSHLDMIKLRDRFLNDRFSQNLTPDLIKTIKTNNLFERNTPLQLILLLRAFENYGGLPNKLYRIIESTIEQLLSNWDKSKDIFVRSKDSLGDNLKILSILSYYLESNEKDIFSISDFQNVYKSENYKDSFSYFSQSGLFCREAPDTYSFLHKNIQEYFLAKYFQECFEINQKPKFLLQFKSHVLEMMVESQNTMAISNYISHTDIKPSNLIYKLVNLYSQKNKIEKVKDLLVDNDDTIKQEWVNLINQKDKLKKGAQLECFIAKFFSTQFKIINKNSHTHNGEIDLVIGNNLSNLFWNEFNADYLVECKFWKKKVPIKEIQAFTQKTVNSNVKLGFFISLSGFTKDASRGFENIASNSSSPMIVPITLEDISKYLSTPERNLNDFLETLVRNIKYKKKY